MYPEIASFGPWTLHSYGLFIAIGVLVSFWTMTRQARKFGFPLEEKVFDLVFVVVAAGFLGARLFYVVQEWPWYRAHPLEIFQIWKGGLVYYGGMAAGFAIFFLYVRLARQPLAVAIGRPWGLGGRARLPFLASADFVIPYIALTHAFGRVGCFLNGCCYGKGNHPTQLYEAVFNLALFGSLIWLYPRRRFAGEVTLLYVILYPAGRFLLEFLRGDQTPWFGPLTLHQLLSLGFIFTGIFFYAICRHRA